MSSGGTFGKRLSDVKRMKEQSSDTRKCACAGARTPWYTNKDITTSGDFSQTM